jgi:primosomal protein N' (replication factor Y)
MRVQIVPILRLPMSLPALDYNVGAPLDQAIRVGHLVKMPFRNRPEIGIVVATGSSAEKISENKLKSVESLVFANPLVSAGYLEFLQEISEFYRAPLGFIFKTAILPLAKKTYINFAAQNTQKTTAVKTTPQKPECFRYHSADELTALINKTAGQKGQKLILTPEVQRPKELWAELKENWRKDCVIVQGVMTDKQYREAWLSVRTNKNALVIGTRKALFLPWTNLKTIIMEDEGNPDYKSWDMSPRYHSRDAVLILAKHTGAKIFFASFAPSVETYYFAANKIYGVNRSSNELNKPAPIFIDLKAERRGGNFGAVSSEIIRGIERADGDVFLFINKRGTSGSVICRDCGHVFKCDKCRRSMTFYQKERKLYCHFCKSGRDLPGACPDCQGVSYRLFALGADGIASELNNTLPKGHPPIVVLDKEHAESLAGLAGDDPKIIVGTEFAWPHIDWKKIQTLIFADPDFILSLPEYKAPEDLWQAIRSAQWRLNKEAKLFIQTSHPEHHVFQGLYDEEKFYRAELAERKVFNYPPYNYLLRLYFGGTDARQADEAAGHLFKQLSALTKDHSDVKIFSPMQTSPAIARGCHWRVIIVKLSYKNYKQRAKELLKTIPEQWKVDPNPNSLISLG